MIKINESQLKQIIAETIAESLANPHKHYKQYRYEEEYTKDGEHHTYRIEYCPGCGKVFGKEKMQ